MDNICIDCVWLLFGVYGFLWVFVATFKLSLVVVNRLLVVVNSCCGAQALHVQLSVAVAHGLWSAQASVVVACGLVNPRHVGSSQTRDRTHVPCIGRRILNYWTTREVPACMFKNTFSTKLFLGASLTIFLILFA